MSGSSPHIIVTEVPPGFLKRRVIRSHFSRFGTIVRLSIQSSYCIITFENHKQALDAIKYGAEWKDMPMKIDFTSNHDPFGTDDAIINEELNWFAEEPGSSDKPKLKTLKSKFEGKFSDDPPKKIGRVDLIDDREDKVSKRPKERFSSTTTFLEAIRSRSNQTEESNKFFDEEKGRPRLRDEKKGRSKLFDRGSSGLSDEEGKVTKFIEDNKGSSLLKLSEENRPLKSSEEGKSILRISEDKKRERESSPMLLDSIKPEGKSLIKTFADRKRERESSPMLQASTEGKSVLKKSALTSRESSPMLFDSVKPEGKSVSRVFEDKKKEQESSPMVLDFGNRSERSLIRSLEDQRKNRESSPMQVDFQKVNKSVSWLSEDMKTISSPTMLDSAKAERQPIFKPFSIDEKEREQSAMLVDVKLEEKYPIKQQDENLFSKAFEESKTASKIEENKVSFKTSESPFYNRAAVSLQDKLDILEERDKQLRLKPEDIEMESVLQGTCPDMCPEKERILRELRNMVAPYEALPDGRMDHSKAVKEYTRSSADQGKPLPHELRPEPVLSMTMSYLINCIISRIDDEEEENLHNWYDFCWGRLRAIRKDIIQQDLCDERTVNILEQCARFHIACYDRLWGLSKSLFDDKLNTETLNNCLTSLMKLYKDLSHEGVSSPNEAEFNAYLILLNMNNAGFLVSRYQKYTKKLKDSPLIKQAVKIHLAYHNNMFSTYFKLTKSTSYLNACLSQRFFQHVRIEALNTIIKSHCTPNKLSSISVSFLMNMLKLDSVEDCVNFCESTGLAYNEDDNCFKIYRNDFYISEDIYKVEAPSSLVVNKRIPITEAVVGSGCPLPVLLKHTVYESFTPQGFLKENALDASGQEEKMLRDNVERKLLLTKFNSSLTHKQQEKSSYSIQSNEDAFVVNEVKVDIEDDRSLSDYENSMPFVSVVDSVEPDNTDTNNVKDLQNKPATFADTQTRISPPKTPATNNVPSFTFSSFAASPEPTACFSSISQSNNNLSKTEPPLVKTFFSNIENFNSSPSSSFEASQLKPQETFGFNAITTSTSGFPPVQKPSEPNTHQPITFPEFKPISLKEDISRSQALVTQGQSNQFVSSFPKDSISKLERSLSENSSTSLDRADGSLKMKPPSKTYGRSISTSGAIKFDASLSKDISIPRRKVKRQAEKKFSKPNLQFDKLRKKLSENMKKVAARKYLRLWKEKASKLKASREFETMVFYNMSANDYIKLWGKPSIKRSLNLSRSLTTRKHSSLLVQMILHTDIINKLDKNVRKTGIAVVNALGEASVKKAHDWGNIAQPNPVFWKLVFALPPPPEGGTTFGMKLRNWCKAAFYSKKNSQLSHAELQMSDSGVPVAINVHVVEGLEELETCANLSALVVIRASDWESTEATENRIEKFLSLSNHPIPIAIFNLGQHVDQVKVNNSGKINYFKQCLWENSKISNEVLCDLARKVHLFNIKIKPFCTLIEISSETLLDSLKQDSFLHDGLYDALKDPNNIIVIYNQLIDKIEQELKECKTGNYFGTAFEFKNDLEEYKNFFMFPDNYKDINFEKSLSLRCQKCKLQPLKTDFKTKKDMGSFFKNYCDDIGCMNILRTILRCFHLPDEDSNLNISEHLASIEWYPIIELLIKEILTSNLLTFKVAYRDDVIKSILQSRFWLESSVIKS